MSWEIHKKKKPEKSKWSSQGKDAPPWQQREGKSKKYDERKQEWNKQRVK